MKKKKIEVSDSEYLDALLQNIPDSVYFKDTESRFLKVSKSLVEKHSLKEEEIIGKNDSDFYSDSHAENAREDEIRIMETGIPLIDKEEYEGWKDNRHYWVSTTKMPLKSKEGEIIGTFGISRNITEKKRTEITSRALLKISEAVFTATDMQSMFVAIHEVLGSVMKVKNIFIALYDEKKDLITFPYYIDEYDEPRESSKPKKGLTEFVLRTGKAQLINEKMDYELREKGEVVAIGTPAKIWLGVPLKIKEKTIGIIVVQDYEDENTYQQEEMELFSFIADQIALVIERKRNAVEIMKYTEELKQLNATKDKFFSIIAHDLKNPFITILGFSEILLSEFNELTDEEKLFYIREMKKSSDTSHSLLQNLLQWSRSQTGFIEFHPQPLSLSTVVNESIDLLRSTASKKMLLMSSSVDETTEVTADCDMLNTVLRNLISNAIKFTPRNGKITISAEEKDGFAIISVQDTGKGMTQETMDSLFRIDLSHSTRGTENEAGSGLGLILCREFVNKNGGEIKVESVLGLGTRFFFSVPLSVHK